MNAIHQPQQSAQLTTAKLLINGQFVESETAQWQDIINPATQELLGRVPFATPEEVNAAIASAQRAFASWKDTPIQARMRIMLKLQDLIRQNAKAIAQVLTAEQGKTLADAEGDIQRGLEVVEHAVYLSLDHRVGNFDARIFHGNTNHVVFFCYFCVPSFFLGQLIAFFIAKFGNRLAV